MYKFATQFEFHLKSICESSVPQPPLPKEDYLTEDHEAPDPSSSVFPKDLLPMPQAKLAVIPRAILDSVPAGWKRSIDADGKTVFTSERTQEQVSVLNGGPVL